MKIYKIILRKTLTKPNPKTDRGEEKRNHSVRPKNEYKRGGNYVADLCLYSYLYWCSWSVSLSVCVCFCVCRYLHDTCSYNKPQELLKQQRQQQGSRTSRARAEHTHTHRSRQRKQMPMCNGAYEGKWQTCNHKRQWAKPSLCSLLCLHILCNLNPKLAKKNAAKCSK